MIDHYALGSVKSKRKSHFWAWFSVVLLMLVVAVYAGWHYGIDDKLKVTADKQAIRNVQSPVTLAIPKIERPTSGRTGNFSWTDVTFEDGLKCRFFKRKDQGATTHIFASSCDWASLPKE